LIRAPGGARFGALPQLAALRHRGFRRLWTSSLISSTGRWADVVVIGWLTLELTDSALMVGIVAASKMAGYLAAPFMGVAADRMDRRRLLVAASSVNLATAATLLLLVVSGLLALWHVIVLALVSSFTWALDNPTRNAFVPDLVGREHFTNAIALNAVAIEITVVVGPALGGVVIPLLGMSGAYGMIAAIFLADLSVLLRLPHVARAAAHARESTLRSLAGGIRYVRENRAVLVLLAIAFMLNLLAAPYRYAFLPLFARYILDSGPAGYGMLTAAAGVGALVAGLWVVSLGDFRHKGRLLVAGACTWPLALMLFAVSRSYALSVALVFLAGLAQAVTWTIIATLILSQTPQPMRGRVMGLRTGVVIGLPIGNFLAGALAERVGAPVAQGAYAVCALAVMIAIVAMVPKLRRLD
jgi:MFS family permease